MHACKLVHTLRGLHTFGGEYTLILEWVLCVFRRDSKDNQHIVPFYLV